MTHFVLAQGFDNVSADWLRNASLFIAGLTATVYYVKQIFWSRPPTVLDVKIVESLATKQELQLSVTRLEREDQTLHKRITDGRTEIEESLRELPMQIVSLLRNTGNLR